MITQCNKQNGQNNIGLSLKIEAISEINRRNIASYELGPDANFPTGNWKPNIKEVGISNFKKKFKTATVIDFFDIFGQRIVKEQF